MALGKKPQINSVRFELVTADGENTGVFWTVESANNPRAMAQSRDADFDALFEVSPKDTENLTDEESRAFVKAKLKAHAKVMAACVTEWEWGEVALYEGEDAFDKPCTFDNVLEVLTAPIEGIDILGQVSKQIADLGKQKPAPKKS